jgi:hypothetical protein
MILHRIIESALTRHRLFQGSINKDKGDDTSYLKYHAANEQPVLRQHKAIQHDAQYAYEEENNA